MLLRHQIVVVYSSNVNCSMLLISVGTKRVRVMNYQYKFIVLAEDDIADVSSIDERVKLGSRMNGEEVIKRSKGSHLMP